MDLSRLEAIIFDVDGTLYRQRPLRRAMLSRLALHALFNPGSAIATFRALGAYRRAQEHLREQGTRVVRGRLAAEQLRVASGLSGQSVEAIGEVVARWMDREPLGILDRFMEPALRPLLEMARSRGIRLGIFSDYPATAKLEALRLTEFFDVVVSAQDDGVNCFKPRPDGLKEALRRLDASASRSLYVGDRHDVDGAAARAAGVPCIIVGRRGDPNVSEGWTPVPDYKELHTLLFSSESEPTR
jgi:FMN phosphatase YigB (HAD superfamily)